ncbi:uncharacterized protein LOC111946614 isoform X1 [Oryzias latipes]
MAEPRVFSKSLSCVPKFTSTDVMRSVKMHSSTKGNKLDKGYKFVHEEFIHHYQVVRLLKDSAMTSFCHPVPERTLFTAGLQAAPPTLSCTSDLQRRHRPRAQGIHPEPVSELVVQRPKTVGRDGLRSTLYKAYTGPQPDPYMMASGSRLCQVQPPEME